MRKGQYRKRLGTADSREFPLLVEELISCFLPNIAQSSRLGALDKDGIDIYQFANHDFSITLAVQCKTFQRSFNSGNIERIEKEVDKFIGKSAYVPEYWLVINKPITCSSDRDSVESLLEKIVIAKKAGTVKLFDLNKFIKEFSKLAIQRFLHMSNKARENYYAVSRKFMQTAEYLPNVPFVVESVLKNNLTQHSIFLLKTYVDGSDTHHTGEYRNPPRFMITGGFGFGKTIGLHAIGELWAKQNQNVLFLPAAAMSDNVFVNSAGLLSDVLNLIVDEDLASSGLAMEILRDACRHHFVTNYPLLIVDAIDESQFWHDPARIR